MRFGFSGRAAGDIGGSIGKFDRGIGAGVDRGNADTELLRVAGLGRSVKKWLDWKKGSDVELPDAPSPALLREVRAENEVEFGMADERAVGKLGKGKSAEGGMPDPVNLGERILGERMAGTSALEIFLLKAGRGGGIGLDL